MLCWMPLEAEGCGLASRSLVPMAVLLCGAQGREPYGAGRLGVTLKDKGGVGMQE